MSEARVEAKAHSERLSRKIWTRLRSGLGSLDEKLRTRPGRLLRVRERLAIGEKRQLLIVQCGDKQLLIGAAGTSLSMLAEVTPLAKPEDGMA
ncbi:MAG TPA: flagellar biosynthetic protein FliO [Terriglobales bacterium]|nr:flagellar biosynthetic protein FliO [Terriglobales bacterium]